MTDLPRPDGPGAVLNVAPTQIGADPHKGRD